jgi:DNA-binding PadR family transcriptional regulator
MTRDSMRDSTRGRGRRPAGPEGPWSHEHRGQGMRGRPGFGLGRHGFGQMPGGRARRGDMQAAILGLLAEQPMHGYQVIQELGTRSGGAWTPGPGSVYPTLQAMEEQGLVTGEQDGSRRVFSLTDTGRAAVVSPEHDREPMPWEQIANASGPRLALRQSIGTLFAAGAQIERTGSDEQIDKAVALIDQARKALYLLLAE